MASTALEAVAEAIADHGPITFAEFMEHSLYGPGGYYERSPVGPAGDFVTSPHVHPLFGQLLAEAIRELYEHLDRPAPFDLIDVGSGDGTLLRQLLPELSDLPLRVTAVERSQQARAALATIDGVTVTGAFSDAPRGSAVVLAHELLDNLAFRWFRGSDRGLREVCVSMHDGRPVVSLEVPDPLPWPDDQVGESHERILAVGARDFIVRALSVDPASPRYLVAVDYGAEADEAGEVHGYRQHRVVEDVIDEPGMTDITAGVPFGDLRRHAEASGMQAFPTVSQRQALEAIGFGSWVASELERQADLLNTGRGGEAARAWGGRSRAGMLVDPAGLGRFRWFVASTPGLPEPSWLARARVT